MWPTWWDWELELTPHVERRMEDRGLTEIDLRDMLERAHGLRRDIVADRRIVETRHANRRREVIIEPDVAEKLLVVIPAYPRESQETK